VCRALVPVIVMAISMFYYGKSFSIQRKLSVLPIVFGVALAFYGDLSFTPVGAFYTLFCVVLAALKAVAGGELLTGDLKLHEIDLLSKMCPLALLQIGLLSVLTGKHFNTFLSGMLFSLLYIYFFSFLFFFIFYCSL
jgi:drug/metabolite transporter (DMT)-like permease